jgi:hypothetical protein
VEGEPLLGTAAANNTFSSSAEYASTLFSVYAGQSPQSIRRKPA